MGVVALLAVAPGAASAAGAKTCTVPVLPGTGTTVTSLKVTKVSCATGTKVVKAFTACRTKTGPTGRCVKKVSGYACREVRQSAPTEITAKVTCTKGKTTVAHGYRQAVGG